MVIKFVKSKNNVIDFLYKIDTLIYQFGDKIL